MRHRGRRSRARLIHRIVKWSYEEDSVWRLRDRVRQRRVAGFARGRRSVVSSFPGYGDGRALFGTDA